MIHEIDVISSVETETVSIISEVGLPPAGSSPVDLSDYYTRQEVDAELAEKANSDHLHAGIYDPEGTANSAISAHLITSDPHPQYQTQDESDARYDLLNAANNAVAGHEALAPHLTPAEAANVAPVQSVAGKAGHVALGIADTTGLQAALDSKAASTHHHDAAYEPKNLNIQAHIGNTANPHGVTAAQVGSYTQAESDMLLSTKATTAHTHAIGDTSGLQAVLDSKAGSAHSHEGLLPIGGTTGQVLTKNGSADYAASWQTPAAGGGGSSLALSSTQLTGGAASIKLALAAAAIAGSVRLVRWRSGSSYELLLNADYKLLDTQNVLLKHGLLPSDVLLVQYWAGQTATPAATAFSALSSTVAWNPADKSASIILSANNTVAEQTTVRCSVRANRAISTPSYWETAYFFSTAPGGAIDLAAGIALAAMPLADWLGQTANSVSGPYASSGNCYYNSTNHCALGVLSGGQRIGHAYNPVSGTYKVTLDGVVWTNVKVGLSGTFYPAATLNSAAQSMLFVANPADMWWAPPSGHTAGIS